MPAEMEINSASNSDQLYDSGHRLSSVICHTAMIYALLGLYLSLGLAWGTVLDLSGEPWHIRTGNASLGSVTLPNYALQALFDQGKVPDPLYRQDMLLAAHAHVHAVIISRARRYGEHDLAWTARENWTFACNFTLASQMLSHDACDLVLHGVDTVADIALNGELVASTVNAFRQGAGASPSQTAEVHAACRLQSSALLAVC